jgi:glycosyltransferase involved in cell wall biosynthesis
MKTSANEASVLVACPDARPPAYQAAIGLARSEMLSRFITSWYYRPDGRVPSLMRRLAPDRFNRIESTLLRRNHSEIPDASVRSYPSFDLSLRVEARLGKDRQRLRRAMARRRTERFDRQAASVVGRTRPGAVLVFSDVGSGETLPTCRALGIPTIVSMVHGVVAEELEVLRQEAETSPEFLPIYLGNLELDHDELHWLHSRRLRDLELADRVLVPSEHIATSLIASGIPEAKVRVVPYAADCRRFRPLAGKEHKNECTFLFAGGISQRKGIKYLLEAWQRVRRPGWRLQLLGAMPKNVGPLEPYLGDVEILGQVSHSQVPALMAAADVFVFPSLFEGSAVVTYEALASGLPSVVTPSAGSVMRDGIEGFEVKPRDVLALAERMIQLGENCELRATMGASARRRAEFFDWPRYHAAVTSVVDELVDKVAGNSNRSKGTSFASAVAN